MAALALERGAGAARCGVAAGLFAAAGCAMRGGDAGAAAGGEAGFLAAAFCGAMFGGAGLATIFFGAAFFAASGFTATLAAAGFFAADFFVAGIFAAGFFEAIFFEAICFAAGLPAAGLRAAAPCRAAGRWPDAARLPPLDFAAPVLGFRADADFLPVAADFVALRPRAGAAERAVLREVAMLRLLWLTCSA